MNRYEVLVLVIALFGIALFWFGPVERYGYATILLGQVMAALLGAMLDRFWHS